MYARKEDCDWTDLRSCPMRAHILKGLVQLSGDSESLTAITSLPFLLQSGAVTSD